MCPSGDSGRRGQPKELPRPILLPPTSTRPTKKPLTLTQPGEGNYVPMTRKVLMSTLHAYTLAEVSAITGIPKSTLYEQAREGRCPELKPIRAGQRTIFPRHHINHLFGIKEAA